MTILTPELMARLRADANKRVPGWIEVEAELFLALLDSHERMERAQQRIDQTGWLIERRDLDMPYWYSLDPAESTFWTKDSIRALRFARKEDAEHHVGFFGDDERVYFVTEHMWVDPLPPTEAEEN